MKDKRLLYKDIKAFADAMLGEGVGWEAWIAVFLGTGHKL